MQQQQQQQHLQHKPDDHRAQDCRNTGSMTGEGGSSDELGVAVAMPTPVAVTVAEGDPLTAATGDRCDWPRWNRAVVEWYERCVREDAEEQDSVEGEEDEKDEYDGTDDMGEGDATDRSGVPEGELPGAVAGGGMLEEFLGREACFTLKCATDQVGHRRLRVSFYVVGHRRPTARWGVVELLDVVVNVYFEVYLFSSSFSKTISSETMEHQASSTQLND